MRDRKSRTRFSRLRNLKAVLGTLGICCLTASGLWAAEKQGHRNDEIDDTIKRPIEESDAERMDRFVIFNEKLKSAICDHGFISKAPTLESITGGDAGSLSTYRLELGRQFSESDLISFLLGDSIRGVYSDQVRLQLETELKSQGVGIEQALHGNVVPDRLLDAQHSVIAVKRRASLEVCNALMNLDRLRRLLVMKPSRFFEAAPVFSPFKTPMTLKKSGAHPVGAIAVLIDSQGRFGAVGDRISTRKRYLVAGWVESFEVERVAVLGARGAALRIYRRISNPVTNNTQSIEVMNAQGVPLGLLYVSREPTPQDWEPYRGSADLPETRLKQLETYRSRIEIDAVRALSLAAGQSKVREQVRNLQEFYKNLLHAYQLFPNEKQFEAYSRSASSRKISLSDVTSGALGQQFLESLGRARVNGSYVHVGLFKPDAKLHAIYGEYLERLGKLVHQ